MDAGDTGKTTAIGSKERARPGLSGPSRRRKRRTGDNIDNELAPAVLVKEGFGTAAAWEPSATRQPDVEVDSNMLRNEFAAFCRTVSREFRIPLRIIEGYADIVVEDCGEELAPAVRRHLHIIREQSRRLSAMIDNTLSLAKILSLPLRRETLDLSALALDAAAVVRAESHAHQVEVRVERGLVAHADAALAAQLLRRLFENAFCFAREAALPLVEFGQTTGGEAFFVRDNGSGLRRDLTEQLLLPFDTLHEGSQSPGSLALAQVQRIVARHGGKVWTEGVPERGTAFYFTLSADAARPSPSPNP